MSFAQKLAKFLADLAARLLPANRHAWGEAMRQEVRAIESAPDALAFAGGCLWAALCERITVMKAIVFTGRLVVGLVTALYGVMFLVMMVNGLTGQAVQPVQPWIVVWVAAMGFSDLAAAAGLVFWKPKLFWTAFVLAALPSLGLTVFGLATRSDMFLRFAWPFVPLALLAGAALFLAWLERGSRRPIAA
ncbi:hypothetical protein ABAC460_15360 [Asticcacaulis sp. AC460]|uniref:hypothetical protein n=1 Tax=Asticcacaulis sp. AC460 TaxID=1282360 RepID=UPI0003C3BFE5|nr:hypothetical protein [Asticcacaulis sp. AC460]ESQ88575.1 hypothetical protein ABAC460_15360 [Asticcacaulis sp. AC460]